MHGLQEIITANEAAIRREARLHDTVLKVRNAVIRLATELANTAASVEDKLDVPGDVADEVNELYAIASALVREAEKL